MTCHLHPGLLHQVLGPGCCTPSAVIVLRPSWTTWHVVADGNDSVQQHHQLNCTQVPECLIDTCNQLSPRPASVGQQLQPHIKQTCCTATALSAHVCATSSSFAAQLATACHWHCTTVDYGVNSLSVSEFKLSVNLCHNMKPPSCKLCSSCMLIIVSSYTTHVSKGIHKKGWQRSNRHRLGCQQTSSQPCHAAGCTDAWQETSLSGGQQQAAALQPRQRPELKFQGKAGICYPLSATCYTHRRESAQCQSSLFSLWSAHDSMNTRSECVT